MSLLKHDPSVLTASDSIHNSVVWILGMQNHDGRWGESIRSCDKPEHVGRGESTAAETAMGKQALLPFWAASSGSIDRGIRWVVTHQSVGDPASVEGGAASWPVDVYTGTGFPNVLYLGYPSNYDYHHAFPITALSECVRAADNENHLDTSLPTILEDQIYSALNRRDALFIVAGSRGDMEPFVRPFVCTLPTQAHIHVAESLGVPLVMVSMQPDMPTGEFPHMMTMTKKVFNTSWLWN